MGCSPIKVQVKRNKTESCSTFAAQNEENESNLNQAIDNINLEDIFSIEEKDAILKNKVRQRKIFHKQGEDFNYRIVINQVDENLSEEDGVQL